MKFPVGSGASSVLAYVLGNRLRILQFDELEVRAFHLLGCAIVQRCELMPPNALEAQNDIVVLRHANHELCIALRHAEGSTLELASVECRKVVNQYDAHRFVALYVQQTDSVEESELERGNKSPAVGDTAAR